MIKSMIIKPWMKAAGIGWRLNNPEANGWINITQHPTAIVSEGDSCGSLEFVNATEGNVWDSSFDSIGWRMDDWRDKYYWLILWRHRTSPAWRPVEIDGRFNGRLPLNKNFSSPLRLP